MDGKNFKRSSLLTCHRVGLCRVDVGGQDLLQCFHIRNPETRQQSKIHIYSKKALDRIPLFDNEAFDVYFKPVWFYRLVFLSTHTLTTTLTAIQRLAWNSPPLAELGVALRENKLQVPQEQFLSKGDNKK